MTAKNLAAATITSGATSRSFADRFLDFINVKDYGAVGDGVTTATNKAAFDAAQTAATISGNTGRVFVPRGTYKLANGEYIAMLHGVSFEGESPASTIINGNVNGFLFDNSGLTASHGGCSLRNLQVNNNNTTDFTSGCLRLSSDQGFYVKNCYGGGMVWLTVDPTPGGLRVAQVGGLIENCMLSGGAGGNTIAIVANSDYMKIAGCCFNAWGYAIVASVGLSMDTCHFETCGVGIVLGVKGSDAATAGPIASVDFSHLSFEACGTAIDSIGGVAGHIHQVQIQCHGPVSGGDNGNTDYGIRLRDDKFISLVLDRVGITGSCDNVGLYIGTCSGSSLRPNNAFNRVSVSLSSGTEVSLPGSATGGSTSPGASAVGNFAQCSFSPIWKYADLPWGVLHTAEINGTTLTYGSTDGRFGVPIMVGGLITGSGVTAGTLVTANGTHFLNGTIDDGSGASGSILNFTSYTGVAPGTGAVVGGGSQLVAWIGTISNGSGSVGHILTITPCTITSASISGATLTFSLVNATNFPPITGGLKNLKVAGAGIAANTFVIAGSGTSWTLNKSVTFGPGTLTFTPDFRPGVALIENNDGATNGWTISSDLGSNQWSMTGASDQLITFTSGTVWTQIVANGTTLTTQNSATSWNVNTAQNQAFGGDDPFISENTWTVSKSQTVGSEDMTSYCCLTGDEFTIQDSSSASSGNFGTVVSAGGGSHTVKLRMDGETGFIIV